MEKNTVPKVGRWHVFGGAGGERKGVLLQYGMDGGLENAIFPIAFYWASLEEGD